MTKETYSWEGLFRGHFAGCRLSVALLLAVAMGTSAFAGNEDDRRKVLPIKEQGSLAAGAKVLKNPGEDGGEFHYDYLYAFYQIPANAAKNSLVMWHGTVLINLDWLLATFDFQDTPGSASQIAGAGWRLTANRRGSKRTQAPGRNERLWLAVAPAT